MNLDHTYGETEEVLTYREVFESIEYNPDNMPAFLRFKWFTEEEVC